MLRIRQQDLPGLKVTIMGLGLHGGGLSSAVFFAERGAQVTVTDLRDRSTLKPSLEKLKPYTIGYTLGEHREEDFTKSDLIIKNPAIPRNSPFLKAAAARGVPVETDLSIFLGLVANPIIAITGSKGKSTASSALHHTLLSAYPHARLGGNITTSPLSFLPELKPADPVVLELSSWQLADLAGKGLLRPRISMVTSILPDHQDRYDSMEDYVADKKLIFREQGEKDYAIFNYQDPYQSPFAAQTRAKAFFFSDSPLPALTEGAFLERSAGWIRKKGKPEQLLDEELAIPGRHNRLNLLAAGLAASLFGLPAKKIRAALKGFPGIEHRLELFEHKKGLKFYNDSAATIPEATAAALKSLKPPIILITGGTDKELDFSTLMEVIHLADKIFLLAGSASEKMRKLFCKRGVAYAGPFDNLKETLIAAVAGSQPGSSILFSPACTSFGMFLNEFDRGRKFKALVAAL